MEMKKIACAVIFAAASLSAVMAANPLGAAATPGATPSVTVTGTPAAAPGPSSGAAGLFPMVGATIVSFAAYYMHF